MMLSNALIATGGCTMYTCSRLHTYAIQIKGHKQNIYM